MEHFGLTSDEVGFVMEFEGEERKEAHRLITQFSGMHGAWREWKHHGANKPSQQDPGWAHLPPQIIEMSRSAFDSAAASSMMKRAVQLERALLRPEVAAARSKWQEKQRKKAEEQHSAILHTLERGRLEQCKKDSLWS